MNKCVIFLFVAALLFGCKKEDKNAPLPKALQLSSEEIAPYQFLSISLPTNTKPINQSSTKEIFSIIGSQTVEAPGYLDSKARINNEFTYFLLVPELPEGTYKIRIKVEGGQFAEASVRIKTFTKISNVSAYLQEVRTRQQQELTEAENQLNAQVARGALRATLADSLKQAMQKAYLENQATLGKLSSAELQVYVQFLEDNKEWVAATKAVFLENPLTTYRRTQQNDCEQLRQREAELRQNGFIDDANHYKLQAEQCEAKREEVRLEQTNNALKRMGDIFSKANEERKNRSDDEIGAWVFLKTVASELSIWFLEANFGIKDLEDPFAIEDSPGTKQRVAGNRSSNQNMSTQETESFLRTQNQSFLLDKEYPYSLGLKLVNLSRKDASFLAPFQKMIQIIDTYNASLEDLRNFLPDLKPMTVPSSSSEILYVSSFTIDQISDPTITVNLYKGGKGNLIKVGSTVPMTQPKSFTFRVNYPSLYGNISKIISATVQPIEPASVIIVSGNNQKAPATFSLPKPLAIQVNDINGQPVPGIAVTWTVTSGGGTLLAANTITNQSGQSTNGWQLGSTGIQTVTATVKKSDGTNVTGSPIVFSAEIKTLKVGDAHEGGIIAYLFKAGDQGYVANQQHGLIASVSNQSGPMNWGCYGTDIPGATGSGIGQGKQNTLDIVAACGGSAAAVAANYSSGGYSDWYLPSTGELIVLYQNKDIIGGFTTNIYWTSTEPNDNRAGSCATAISFEDGGVDCYIKPTAAVVRAIRYF